MLRILRAAALQGVKSAAHVAVCVGTTAFFTAAFGAGSAIEQVEENAAVQFRSRASFPQKVTLGFSAPLHFVPLHRCRRATTHCVVCRVAMLGCKRPRREKLSLPTFCGCASRTCEHAASDGLITKSLPLEGKVSPLGDG